MRKLIDDHYEIIREISTGGFGTIFYGWDLTLDRPVAIKEIVQSLLGEQQYVDMFIDEALNTARLNHPNIVQVYNLRRTSDNHVFIIMEYIEGVDLRDVISYYSERDETFPEHLAVFIIGEVCKALEYAHGLKDRKTGQPLNIVHRDISPSNIMLTVEGSVKLIDFGIAKARHRTAKKTQTGFVKGKIAYMSPEQLEGKEATRQSDLFSLGSLFCELCTGKMLFTGDSDFSTMKKIVTCEIDFSPLENLKLIPGLTNIIRKALTKDLSKRFATANEMYVELYKFSRQHYQGEPVSDLSRLVHAIYVKAPEEELKPDVQAAQEKIKTQILSAPDTPRPAVTPEPERPSEGKKREEFPAEARTVIREAASEEAKTVIFDSSEIEAKSSIKDMSSAKSKSPKSTFSFKELLSMPARLGNKMWIFGGVILAALALIIVLAVVFSGGSKDKPRGDYRVWINSEPEGAEVFLNGQSYGKTPLQLSELDDGNYALRLSLAGASDIDSQFALKAGEKLTFPNFVFSREVYLNSIPAGADIYVNNTALGAKTPFLARLPMADSVDIMLRLAGSKNPVILTGLNAVTGSFKSGDNSFWSRDSVPGASRLSLTGRFLKEVSISSKPQGADIYIEGEAESLGQTPGQISLPFGEARIKLVKPGFKDKFRVINIDENFQGALFYELLREVQISAVSEANLTGTDIGANIVKIECEGKTTASTDKTPVKLLLTGVEQKLYFSKDGYRDTSFIVGVNQTELKAVLREESGKAKTASGTKEEVGKGELIFIFSDKKTREAVAGVQVVAERKDDKKKILLGSSDVNGRLAVRLEDGEYKFTSSKDGYKDWDDGKSIKKGKDYKLEVSLKKK